MDTHDDNFSPPPSFRQNLPLNNNFHTGLALRGVTDRQLPILVNPEIVKNEPPHKYYTKLCNCLNIYDLCRCYQNAIKNGDKHFIAGSGVNGAIWKLKNKTTGEIVVQKKFKIDPRSDNGKAEREIALHYMAQQNCDNVTQIRDIFRVNSKKPAPPGFEDEGRMITEYYVMMENCEGGELFDYIVKRKRLPEMEACKIF